MRKPILQIFIAAAILSMAACGESNKNVVNEPAVATEQIPTEPSTPNYQVSEVNLEKSVTYLASDELAGRETGTEGIEKAAAYIEKNFNEGGIEPFFETYRDHFKVNEIEAFNVVGFVKGNNPDLKDEIVIIGAHYDHVGEEKEIEGDIIANGANDNASGTASVIELANHFAQHKKNGRSLMFVLFSAEEMGLKGSDHLAKRLKERGTKIYAMLNIEMIGVPMHGKDYEAYLTGYNKSNFADLFNLYSGAEVLGFLPEASKYQLFQRSDNYPFYTNLNIPAQTLSTFDFTNYDYYHHVKDEAQLMDYAHMARLIEKLIPGIQRMTETEQREIKMN